MAEQISLRALNRTTLQRQGLVDRLPGDASEVVRRLAGLQAQHADQPYVALWSRRDGSRIADLQQALTDRTVVKATLMRTTLHLVAASDYPALDAVSAVPRLATWGPSAQRAGIDLVQLNAEARAFCAEPRTVAEIQEHLAAAHPGVDAASTIPGGVRNAWFRLASAAGGLVHVPPSGMWRWHGKAQFADAARWLGEPASPGARPGVEAALELAVRRFLAAYGPASAEDIVKWAGQRRVTAVRTALAALGEELVSRTGPDGRELVDLVGLPLADEDEPAPPRFLSRWDSLLIAYDVRDRVLPPQHVAAVVRKNGDFLPTFLLGGFVAGLWTVNVARGSAVLHLEPFGAVSAADRAALQEEAERLVRFVEPEAGRHDVAWA